jgi:hypothetical protein
MGSTLKQPPKSASLTSISVSDDIGRQLANEELVRVHAYLLFQERERTGTPGDAASDWLHAQRELSQAAEKKNAPRPD